MRPESFSEDEIPEQSVLQDNEQDSQDENAVSIFAKNSDILPGNINHSSSSNSLHSPLQLEQKLQQEQEQGDDLLNTSTLTLSFKKGIPPVLVKVQKPIFKSYAMSLTVCNVLVHLHQGPPEDLFEQFNCIALPFTTLPLTLLPLKKMKPKRWLPQKNKEIVIEQRIMEHARRGGFAIGGALFLDQVWFHKGQKKWSSGVVTRAPQFGDPNDRMLLFSCVQNILKQYDLNFKDKTNQGLQKGEGKANKSPEVSIVIPWLVEDNFPIRDAAEITIYSLLKSLKDSESSRTGKVSICVSNKEQLKELRDSLRRKLMILLDESQ